MISKQCREASLLGVSLFFIITIYKGIDYYGKKTRNRNIPRY